MFPSRSIQQHRTDNRAHRRLRFAPPTNHPPVSMITGTTRRIDHYTTSSVPSDTDTTSALFLYHPTPTSGTRRQDGPRWLGQNREAFAAWRSLHHADALAATTTATLQQQRVNPVALRLCGDPRTAAWTVASQPWGPLQV